jgi:hypothetical protein
VYVVTLPVTGLDLPVKLRRGLGNGKVVPAEELARRLAAYDSDQDGAVTREELARFLLESRCGGPWFCQMVSHNVFATAEDRWSQQVAAMKVVALARIINYTMARANKPVKRYILTPQAVLGMEPKRGLKGEDPTVTTESLMPGNTRPRPSAEAPAPRPNPAPAPAPQPAQARPQPRPAEPRAAPGLAAPRPRPSGAPGPSGRPPAGRVVPRGPRRPGGPRR